MFVELRGNRKIFGKRAPAPPLDVGRDNRNVNAAYDGHPLRDSFKIGSQPGHLFGIETGVDGVFALTFDDGVAVERNEVHVAKIKGIISRAEAFVKQSSWIRIV